MIELLGEAIVSGSACARRDLPRESELMSGQEVSRTSIREAMKVLAAKGLVEIREKTGTRVRPLDLLERVDADVLRWHLRLGRGEFDPAGSHRTSPGDLEGAAACMAAGRVDS